MIFLSFAPNFNFSQSVRHLFACGTKKHSAALISTLKDRYQGVDVQLYHNGRTALSEALKILVSAGSHVAINGLTCYAVPQAVKSADCTPVYIDINPKDFNFDTKKLRETLEKNPRIKAIIIQNHLGLTADIAAIEKLAKKHNFIIIEDLAHCAGSHYADGREVGTVGAAAALSFGKGKSIDTTEGGALVVRMAQPALEERLQSVTTDETRNGLLPVTTGQHPFRAPKEQVAPKLTDRVRDRIYPITGWLIRKTFRIGFGKIIAACAFRTGAVHRSAEGKIDPTLRPTHWQARLALHQLKDLDQTAKTRAKFAASYGYPKTLSTLRIPFLVNHRDILLRKLKAHHIYLDDSWYETPVSPRRYYHKADFSEKSCPVATQVASQMLNLPLLPEPKLKTALQIIQSEIIK